MKTMPPPLSNVSSSLAYNIIVGMMNIFVVEVVCTPHSNGRGEPKYADTARHARGEAPPSNIVTSAAISPRPLAHYSA